MQAGASNASQRGCEALRGRGSLPAWKAPGWRVPTPCGRDAGPARNTGREGVSSSPQGRFAWKESARPEGVPERCLARIATPGGRVPTPCLRDALPAPKQALRAQRRKALRTLTTLTHPRSRRAPARRPEQQLLPHTPARPSPTTPGRAERLHRRPDQQIYPNTRQSHLVLPDQTTQRQPPPTASPRSAFKRKPSTSRSSAPAHPPALESPHLSSSYASRQGFFWRKQHAAWAISHHCTPIQ